MISEQYPNALHNLNEFVNGIAGGARGLGSTPGPVKLDSVATATMFLCCLCTEPRR